MVIQMGDLLEIFWFHISMSRPIEIGVLSMQIVPRQYVTTTLIATLSYQA